MATVTLVSPPSVAGWYAPLGGDATRILVIGEQDVVELDDIAARIRAIHGDRVRVHSGHDSLRRDRALADRLADAGLVTFAQSARAVEAGVDKVFAREQLELADIAVTPWGSGAVPRDGDYIVKARDSTQSRSVFWSSPAQSHLDSSFYWERWMDGQEYSVVGYRESGVTTILPIVGKGATRRDLLPPWQRARTVSPHSLPRGADEMIAISRRAAKALDLWGFFEIEFVVSDRVSLIEVNPRISGTLRLAAMSANCAIFAEHALDSGEDIQPTLTGVEVPYSGVPFTQLRLIATSRLTCVGDSFEEIHARVTEAVPELELSRELMGGSCA